MRLIVGLLVIALLAPLAAGHTGLTSARPADGATVGVAPDRVVLTFAQPPGRAGEVSVTGPSGSELTAGGRQDPRDARRLIAEIGPDGGGAYSVRWSIVAADGHTIVGTTTFRARRGAMARSTDALRRSLLGAGAALRRAAR